LQEQVAAREQGDQEPFDHDVLTDDYPGDALADVADEVDRVGHVVRCVRGRHGEPNLERLAEREPPPHCRSRRSRFQFGVSARGVAVRKRSA
jgi:hypothetical protein